ncbi:MAG: TIGR03986 family CRISPR-associated RAMP protein [Cyanobacteriota bacterium]|nr:TIGR03986 family CRISPR-associated RAMP protein [Cyanobacteriota bacterium]
MNYPKHIRKVPKKRQAIAPYNFVELPNKIIEAQELPENNKYYPENERNTGRIKCTLTTSSPLYTRCGLTQEQFRKGKEAKDIPDFSYTDIATKKPVIPGSSLRGMLRTLVEIISFSKIDLVSNEENFFFRAVAADKEDPLQSKYRDKLQNIKVGYLQLDKNTGQWYIQFNNNQEDSYIPVKESELEKNTLPSLIPMKKENYLPQYIEVSFERDLDEKTILVDEDVEKYQQKGWLLTSGNMLETSNLTEAEREAKLQTKEGRKYHYIIPKLSDSIERIEISPDSIKDYKSALTDFQKGKPFKENTKNPFNENIGILKDGRPIFYSQPELGKSIKLFGQSPNFRIPYIPKGKETAASAVDFIPEELRNLEIIDIADAIFGWVRREKQSDKTKQSRAGRINVSDGICISNIDDVFLEKNPITPKILASPKPTTFQHYLVQPEETEAEKQNLKHYASKPREKTVIRGHKLYWHKGKKLNIKLENSDEVSDTQTTQIKPIKSGVSFQFNIHFENLTNEELGALMWVLDVAQDDNYRLKLGMGKPLGMGAVKIEHKLYLSDRQKRYKKLFDSNNWEIAEILEKKPDYKQLFENYMLVEKLKQTGKFEDICRIKMLLQMLSWPGLQNPEKTTRYMEIERKKSPRLGNDENEYKERLVLPTPLQVAGVKLECDCHSSQQTSVKSDPKSPEKETNNTPVLILFKEQDEVDAKVIDIEKKEIQSGKQTKLKTIITYEITGSDSQATEVIHKKEVNLEVGDIVKVKIEKVTGNSIRKVKQIENNKQEVVSD